MWLVGIFCLCRHILIVSSQSHIMFCCTNFSSFFYVPSTPVDNIWTTMIIWGIRGKILRTVLCCIVYDSCAVVCTVIQTHIWTVCKVNCWFRFRFLFLCFLPFCLYVVCFVMLGLVTSVVCQEIGREESILCQMGHKTLTQSISQLVF